MPYFATRVEDDVVGMIVTGKGTQLGVRRGVGLVPVAVDAGEATNWFLQRGCRNDIVVEDLISESLRDIQ